MTRKLLAVLAIGLLVTAPAAAHAQLNTSFGVGGGIAAPIGDLRNIANAGYNVEGHLNLGAPLIPVGLRLEVGYNSFNFKSSTNVSGSANVLSGTVNAMLALGPTGASPYLIGGVGAYNVKADLGGLGNNSQTEAGFNVGGGIRFPLGLLSTFLEARYHKTLGNSNTQYVPITFGINF